MKITVKCEDCENSTETDIMDIFECDECGSDTAGSITAVSPNEFGLTTENIDDGVLWADEDETNAYLAYVDATGAHYASVEEASENHVMSGDVEEYLFQTFIEHSGIEISENYLDRDYIVSEMRYDYCRGIDLNGTEHVFYIN